MNTNRQEEIDLQKFLFNIQREKMKELWDNDKDKIWESV
jgi:hypothetical protein